MERLVPLTKILMTLAVSVWAILLRDWVSLSRSRAWWIVCGRFVVQTTQSSAGIN